VKRSEEEREEEKRKGWALGNRAYWQAARLTKLAPSLKKLLFNSVYLRG